MDKVSVESLSHFSSPIYQTNLWERELSEEHYIKMTLEFNH